MKNISLYLSIFALVAVTLLFIDRMKSNSAHKTKGSENIAESDSKIAYVNIDSLVDSYDFYNEIKTNLIGKQKNMEADLESRYKSLQNRAYDLQQKVEKKMMTPTTAQSEQEKLMAQQQQIMNDKQNLEAQLGEENQKMLLQTLDSITKFLKVYNKSHNYTLILSNQSVGGTVLLANDKNMNITKEVIEGLNKNYRKKSGVKESSEETKNK